ncbi:MAG: hypothetical protein Q4C41_03445 [Eggerthellaceae bacterium]|nr:hypothetical protein [Eggerthellaceae bacterium]
MALVGANTDSALMHVQVEGLTELMRNLKLANADGEKIVKEAIQESGSMVLASARAKASAFSASGAFKSTLSIKDAGKGIKLSSTDEAAGVIEFAKHGAITRTSKGTARANARLAAHSGVGVPRGTQPRSMVPAVNENTLAIQNKVAYALERAMCGNG